MQLWEPFKKASSTQKIKQSQTKPPFFPHPILTLPLQKAEAQPDAKPKPSTPTPPTERRRQGRRLPTNAGGGGGGRRRSGSNEGGG